VFFFLRKFQTGARFTGQAIAADEYAQPNLLVDYDGKRDRWNGYDPSEHGAIIEEFQKVEDAKRLLKEEKLKATPADGEEGEGEVSVQIVDSKEPLTVTFLINRLLRVKLLMMTMNPTRTSTQTTLTCLVLKWTANRELQCEICVFVKTLQNTCGIWTPTLRTTIQRLVP